MPQGPQRASDGFTTQHALLPLFPRMMISLWEGSHPSPTICSSCKVTTNTPSFLLAHNPTSQLVVNHTFSGIWFGSGNSYSWFIPLISPCKGHVSVPIMHIPRAVFWHLALRVCSPISSQLFRCSFRQLQSTYAAYKWLWAPTNWKICALSSCWCKMPFQGHLQIRVSKLIVNSQSGLPLLQTPLALQHSDSLGGLVLPLWLLFISPPPFSVKSPGLFLKWRTFCDPLNLRLNSNSLGSPPWPTNLCFTCLLFCNSSTWPMVTEILHCLQNKVVLKSDYWESHRD